MPIAQLTQLRLTAFKSFRGAVLPVDDVTVLTGRNSSGKSNALDAIEVLSRLASGEDLADALDGRRREGGPVRGGSVGCAPHGDDSFELGCTVRVGHRKFSLDVRVQVRPDLRIVSERLTGPAPAVESGDWATRDLMFSMPANRNAAGLEAKVHNGKSGPNPVYIFRDTRLLTAQLPLRLAPNTKADRAVINAAEAVVSALRGVFHLDPVPHLMRSFVPRRDSDLRRTGENLSAAVARLKVEDEVTFKRVADLVRHVADERIEAITTRSSELGDVMLALKEGPAEFEVTSAREMSDGLLRFIAIATAMLTSNRGLDVDKGLTHRDVPQGITVVIEELENGLHPAQADRVLKLILETSSQLATRVIVTTHSPALLNAMSGKLNRSVLVCYRDEETGHSKLVRLPELPGYASAMASGPIGDVISMGDLVRPAEPAGDFTEFNRLIGIE